MLIHFQDPNRRRDPFAARAAITRANRPLSEPV